MSATTRDIDLLSARGERLAGVLHEPEGPPRGLVVLAPCFTCTRDIAPVRNLARDLAGAGFRACRYDPFGSGKSEGRFADATLSRYRDDLVAVASRDDLRGAAPTGPPQSALQAPRLLPLHLVGHSLGGATSLLAARALAPRSVTTLATNARKDSLRRLLGPAFEKARTEGSVPFDSGDGVIRPLTRAFVEDLEAHDVLGAAAALDCPLLVVHGDRDSLVPLDAARELAARAPRSELVVVPGAEHLLSRREDRDRIRAAALAFLDAER